MINYTINFMLAFLTSVPSCINLCGLDTGRESTSNFYYYNHQNTNTNAGGVSTAAAAAVVVVGIVNGEHLISAAATEQQSLSSCPSSASSWPGYNNDSSCIPQNCSRTESDFSIDEFYCNPDLPRSKTCSFLLATTTEGSSSRFPAVQRAAAEAESSAVPSLHHSYNHSHGKAADAHDGDDAAVPCHQQQKQQHNHRDYRRRCRRHHHSFLTYSRSVGDYRSSASTSATATVINEESETDDDDDEDDEDDEDEADEESWGDCGPLTPIYPPPTHHSCSRPETPGATTDSRPETPGSTLRSSSFRWPWSWSRERLQANFGNNSSRQQQRNRCCFRHYHHHYSPTSSGPFVGGFSGGYGLGGIPSPLFGYTLGHGGEGSWSSNSSAAHLSSPPSLTTPITTTTTGSNLYHNFCGTVMLPSSQSFSGNFESLSRSSLRRKSGGTNETVVALSTATTGKRLEEEEKVKNTQKGGALSGAFRHSTHPACLDSPWRRFPAMLHNSVSRSGGLSKLAAGDESTSSSPAGSSNQSNSCTTGMTHVRRPPPNHPQQPPARRSVSQSFAGENCGQIGWRSKYNTAAETNISPYHYEIQEQQQKHAVDRFSRSISCEIGEIRRAEGGGRAGGPRGGFSTSTSDDFLMLTQLMKFKKEFRIQRRHSHRHRKSFHAGGGGAPSNLSATTGCRSPSLLLSGSGGNQHVPSSASTSHHHSEPQNRLIQQHLQHHHSGGGSGSYNSAAGGGGVASPRGGGGRCSTALGIPDNRRWSLASLPSSSGYGTPGSSAFSSQYSSTERLAVAMEELLAYSSGGGGNGGMIPIVGGGASSSSSKHHHQPATTDLALGSGGVDKADSNNPSLDDLSADGRIIGSVIRPRSRSLSSMAWLNLSSSQLENSPTNILFNGPCSDAMLKNSVYKERFPKAKQQMEERLEKFIADNNEAMGADRSSFNLTASPVNENADLMNVLRDGAGRFLLHQVLETATDCLQKSRDDLITSGYFVELNQNLNDLICEAKDKSAGSVAHLSKLIRELLMMVSRPARLLECLEFDPEEYYHMLEVVEGQVRSQLPSGGQLPAELPHYIVEKLGLSQSGQMTLSGSGAEASVSASDQAQSLTTETGSSRMTGSFPPASAGIMQSSTDSGLASSSYCLTTSSSTSSAAGQSSTTMYTAVEGPDPMVARNRSESGQEPTSVPQANSSSLFAGRPPSEDDFESVKLISNGAYGAVWLVRHRETRERFALKKLSKRNMMLRNAVEQVYAERDILTFTDNPFVVSFYGSFETKSHLCMVMEYVEGGDCASLIKAIGSLPVETSKPYIAETVLAIEYLHSYGIVHRDIKPDNLLITAMGHVKLTDFGLSKIGLMNRTTLYAEGMFLDPYAETHQFKDNQLCGTPEYIAPEVILRQGYGKPVDWWALGIIMYEFLFGFVPFQGETPEDLFHNIIQEDVPWPTAEDGMEDLDDAAVDLVNVLLMKNPLDRLGTCLGAEEVKTHPFFDDLDYRTILKQKAEFIPQLDNEEDTSYFDTRADRYNHANESDMEAAGGGCGDQSGSIESGSFLNASGGESAGRDLSEQCHSAGYLPSAADSAVGGNSIFWSFSSAASPRNSYTAGFASEISSGSISMTDGPAIQPSTVADTKRSISSPSCGVILRDQSQSSVESGGFDSGGILNNSIDSGSRRPTAERSETVRQKAISTAAEASSFTSQTSRSAGGASFDRKSSDESDSHQFMFGSSNSASNTVQSETLIGSTTGRQGPVVGKPSGSGVGGAVENLFIIGATETTSKDPSPVKEKQRCPPSVAVGKGRTSTGQIQISRTKEAAVTGQPVAGNQSAKNKKANQTQSTAAQRKSQTKLLLLDSADNHIPPSTSTETPLTTGDLQMQTPHSSSKSTGSTALSASKSHDAAAASSLHLVIPDADSPPPPPPPFVAAGCYTTARVASPSASSTSSRDDSPNRLGIDISPAILQLKPPIVLRKGTKGFGFTVRSVRVYLGADSEYYTIQHITSTVEPGSPAFEAGLKPDELITHINGDSAQNLTHPQLMQRLFSFGETLKLRTVPMDQTSIRTGAPRKAAGKMARKKGGSSKQKLLQRRVFESKKRKLNLLRRLSGKREGVSGGAADGGIMPRSVSSQDGMITPSSSGGGPMMISSSGPSSGGSGSSSPSAASTTATHSNPHSPAGLLPLIAGFQHHHHSTTTGGHRPSSLIGLKQKLQHTLKSSPGRRKSGGSGGSGSGGSGVMPLSPLARVAQSQQHCNNQDSTISLKKKLPNDKSSTAGVTPSTSSASMSSSASIPNPKQTGNSIRPPSPSRSPSPSPLAAGCATEVTTTIRSSGGCGGGLGRGGRHSSNARTLTKPRKSDAGTAAD